MLQLGLFHLVNIVSYASVLATKTTCMPAHACSAAGRRPTAKHGGGRDGYAVATDVLDDDWAEEFEVVADDEEGIVQTTKLPLCESSGCPTI